MIRAHSLRSCADELQKIAINLSSFSKMKPPASALTSGLRSNYSQVGMVTKAPSFGPNLSPPPLGK